MAVGWANDDSVSQQIQNTIDDEISRVCGSITKGESAHYCDECGDEIPEARRLAMKGVRLCIELVSQRQVLFNRRASKDSQLR
ncbi:DksA/TraR family C4-type zinc finger protein [Vibrio diabolicus]|uniref:DksA/TraR family C4-type zinc finger protein n=1 Tax=Vibrio diabolicus TaxID=50719 RepID=UPI0037530965